MKKLMKKLEDMMVAITFAEAGEYDEAVRQESDAAQEEIVTASVYKRTADNAK